MKNLAHNASLESLNKNAPSKSGTKHLGRLAGLPTVNHARLSQKKAMIGKAWFCTDSLFRDAVASDEAYLKTKARPRKKAAQ